MRSFAILALLATTIASGFAADFPLDVFFRKAKNGTGYAVVMTNASKDSVRVKVHAGSKDAEKVVDPKNVWIIGGVDGFEFVLKDSVTIMVGDQKLDYVLNPAKEVKFFTAFRAATFGNSQVFQLFPAKGFTAAFTVTAERPSTGEKKIFAAKSFPGAETEYVDQGAKLELGHMEGWSFAKGDKVTITTEGIDPVVVTVP